VEHIVIGFTQMDADNNLNLIELPNQVAKEIGYKSWAMWGIGDYSLYPAVGHPFADYWGNWVDTDCGGEECCFVMGGCGDGRPYPPPRQTPIDQPRGDLDPSLCFDVSEYGHLGYDDTLGAPDPDMPVQSQYTGTWEMYRPPNDDPRVAELLAKHVNQVALCGNGFVDAGEECGEPGLGCNADEFCMINCQCGTGCSPGNTIAVECSATAEEATHTEILPDEDCDGIAEGNCAVGTCSDPGQCDDADPPTVVELSVFKVKRLMRMARIVWMTAAEIDSAGFNLYRAGSENGNYFKINDSLIPAEGTPTQGAVYEFIDDDLRNRQTYWYKLEDIDVNGVATMHGPVRAMPGFIHNFIQ